MNNEELKKKIVIILEDGYIPIEYDDGGWGQTYFPTNEDVADSLITNGIGDVSEWKHQAEVLRLALSKSVLDENAIFDDDVCRYILSNTRLTEEYYIEQAEKELAEEEK